MFRYLFANPSTNRPNVSISISSASSCFISSACLCSITLRNSANFCFASSTSVRFSSSHISAPNKLLGRGGFRTASSIKQVHCRSRICAARYLSQQVPGIRRDDRPPLDRSGKLGFHCPVCQYPLFQDDEYDDRLKWSQYNGFLSCSVCDKDYPSALCLPNAGPTTKQQWLNDILCRDFNRR